ncbi:MULTISPECIES: nitroreductase family deazaflavin-dependent oxidoreductase [unclassified Gordonia (in: high G+C Gram-positive bacteria)]|uniref:nitroreductase family deazaflavin-dependent oxidoreductase n=1 Tax=unclassified Gordonia (in: high G+C Gram-positive bacteria) TaxID=2657482 RepID=UPI0007E9F89A|nr:MULTISPECIES: nitroreductase family deazaflavin-dependent oxidoreductase [unclassified Gordonia (in: high G+C Gram-positive bacteria)]OBB99635.1 nitroreductase [Gordonia sp. 852002-50395_SCH5434458]OBC13892.1 nitroreductase [Gordonia sp. 852002-50816_SCH5313054-c]OBC16200.1 nitroreductase [Gordonia sp. 852002-50816_SCH5313054-a]
MTEQSTYEPSPSEMVREQVAKYESSGGTEGNTLAGVPVVVMTMRGATSGKIRKVPVMRVEHDGQYAALASKGGAPTHPAWYRNLLADPQVTVQDGPTSKTYRAEVVTGDERDEWWDRAVAIWPAYNDYQAKTNRKIPVFVLRPQSEQ